MDDRGGRYRRHHGGTALPDLTVHACSGLVVLCGRFVRHRTVTREASNDYKGSALA
jgi:hypothetical protein